VFFPKAMLKLSSPLSIRDAVRAGAGAGLVPQTIVVEPGSAMARRFNRLHNICMARPVLPRIRQTFYRLYASRGIFGSQSHLSGASRK
jgi:DNA-binding transcriptional LysR family regulator